MAEQVSKMYLCIDLKSFYASVECVERGLDPMTTNLVVADPTRTQKTICLAVSPSMKALGVKNRCRVFEIPKGIDYIMAPPQMRKYIQFATDIYGIYLRYLSKEDIQVYSIDEAFMDVTEYLTMYQMTAKELGMRIMEDIREEIGVTATCGIGTNLYLTKIALDITAKHTSDNIGYLDEERYRETLWNHRPLTDFWRVGAGTEKRLAHAGIFTMGQIAQADEELLYRMFGIDAELLIDHAWGREPVTIADIKRYKPANSCVGSSQVLARDYEHEECGLIVKEMTDLVCLELMEKGLVTESITLHMGYSNQLEKKPAHGTTRLSSPSNLAAVLIPQVLALYEEIADATAPIRRLSITCNRVMQEEYRQYNLFEDPEETEKERKVQQAVLDIKKKFGKNAILKGMNLEEGGTTRERNTQIGGHRGGE